MLEISIGSELAAAHPVFMAGCAERGHQVDVFGDAERNADEEGTGRSLSRVLGRCEPASHRDPGHQARGLAEGGLADQGG